MQPFSDELHQPSKTNAMKKYILLLFVALSLGSCKDKIYKKYLAYTPIYQDYGSFRNSVKFEGARAISDPGGIYKKDNYLFIVEKNKGIHLINNANPEAPQATGFLKIDGCTGMAIKGQYLFVNHRIDLAVIDISSIQNPVVVERQEDIFPTTLPEHDGKYPTAQIDKAKGVVVGWEVKETKEEVSQTPTWINCPTCVTNNLSIASATNADWLSSNGAGQSGSITKFALSDNYLYVMDNHFLHALNIANPLQITHDEPIADWNEVETLFPYNGILFMGTTTGMRIYSLANPAVPNFVSMIDHALACDPVVVQGNYAYVTIRTGTLCNGSSVNQLDVIDLSNISNPILKQTFAMHNPHGLGIEGDLLFICDGDAGLKIFDASNPLTCGNQLIHQFPSVQATDIIPQNGIAIMIGEDGLYQYDYTNPNAITLLSTIQFN